MGSEGCVSRRVEEVGGLSESEVEGVGGLNESEG